MMRKPFFLMVSLLCTLGLLVACQGDNKVETDRAPLPVTAAPPYVCGYVPLKAVELITGVQNPLVRGSFDLTLGAGNCTAYQPDGDRLKVLQIVLAPGAHLKEVRNKLEGGASPLPEIIDGSIGYYLRAAGGEDDAAYSMLIRGEAEVIIKLEIGVKGRDNAADVLALMKLIAPKLITDASAPSASPSATASLPAKG